MDCTVAWATIVLLSLPVFARQANPREERILEVARRIEHGAAPLGEAAAVSPLAGDGTPLSPPDRVIHALCRSTRSGNSPGALLA